MSTLKARVAQRATGTSARQDKDLAVRERVRTARHLLAHMRPQFEMALPRHIGVDRFLRTAFTCVQQNPKLLECTQESLLAALLEAARLGLEPGTRQAAIVPYKQQATLVVQWQGLVELMYRSGQVVSVTAEFIHEGDEWDYRIGDGGTFWHRPNLLGERGKPVLCYAYAELKGGGRSKIVTLTRREAEEIRDRFSRAYHLAEQHRREDPDGFQRNPDSPWFTSPWHTDFEAMWRKSTVRRLADWVPQSPELAELLSRDGLAGDGTAGADGEVEVVDVAVTAEPEPQQGAKPRSGGGAETAETASQSTTSPAAGAPADPGQGQLDEGWPPVTKPGSGGATQG